MAPAIRLAPYGNGGISPDSSGAWSAQLQVQAGNQASGPERCDDVHIHARRYGGNAAAFFAGWQLTKRTTPGARSFSLRWLAPKPKLRISVD